MVNILTILPQVLKFRYVAIRAMAQRSKQITSRGIQKWEKVSGFLGHISVGVCLIAGVLYNWTVHGLFLLIFLSFSWTFTIDTVTIPLK